MRDNGKTSLVIKPSFPVSVPSYELHPELVHEFGKNYITCHRAKSNDIVVRFASAALAQQHRGQSLQLSGSNYRLEYTNSHSRNFICYDIGGLQTDEIVTALEETRYVVTEPTGFIFRQRYNGPVVALHFDEAPLKLFSIEIRLGHLRFEFCRAISTCVLCQEQHEVTACPEMVNEQKAVVFTEVFHNRKEQITKELYDNLKVLKCGESSDDILSRLHDCRARWNKIQEELALCAQSSSG